MKKDANNIYKMTQRMMIRTMRVTMRAKDVCMSAIAWYITSR